MNDISVLSVFLTIVVGVLIVGILRIGSFRLKANKYVEEGVPKLITLGKWWHLIYEVYPYEIEKDYNWTEIKADIQKGVPSDLALQREKVVALEMLQYEFSEHWVSHITLRDEDGIFWESLDAYVDDSILGLYILENDYSKLQAHILLGSMLDGK